MSRRGRSLMRNYINATVGFPRLSKRVRIPKTSLMRMFGPNGNPSADNLFSIIVELQKQEGVSLAVHAVIWRPVPSELDPVSQPV